MRRRRRRAGARSRPSRVYTIYVVELHERVWERSRKLRAANPDGRPDRPCVYVGSTVKTPEERLEVHRRGVMQSAKIVFRYGRELRRDLYVDLPPICTTRADAEAAERRHAERLRRRGVRVWQG